MSTDPTPSTGTQVRASITVEIDKKPFTLTGTVVGSDFMVSYHREFEDAPTLGTIKGAAVAVADAFNVKSDEFTKNIDAFFSTLPTPLAAIGNAILTAEVRITDLGINTAAKTYEIGFALDFRGVKPAIAVGPVALRAFGVIIRTSAERKP